MEFLTIAFLDFKIGHAFDVCVLVTTVFGLRYIWLRTFQWSVIELMTMHVILPNQLVYLVNILKSTFMKKFFNFGVVLIHVVHIVYKALVDTATNRIVRWRLKCIILLLNTGDLSLRLFAFVPLSIKLNLLGILIGQPFKIKNWDAVSLSGWSVKFHGITFDFIWSEISIFVHELHLFFCQVIVLVTDG